MCHLFRPLKITATKEFSSPKNNFYIRIKLTQLPGLKGHVSASLKKKKRQIRFAPENIPMEFQVQKAFEFEKYRRENSEVCVGIV